MDNQHKKISGYRDLSQAEIDAMNGIKHLEKQWNGMIDHLRALPDADQRQVSIAATDAESAFMRAVRAVARPERQASQYVAPRFTPGTDYEKESEPGKEPVAGRDFDEIGTPAGYANGIPHKRPAVKIDQAEPSKPTRGAQDSPYTRPGETLLSDTSAARADTDRDPLNTWPGQQKD